MLKQEILYQPNSANLFARIADRPWAVFLDSGQPESQFGRFDIMAANPFIRLITSGAQTLIIDQNGSRSSDADPFELLKASLAPYALEQTELPFEGGAIGYFGYDLARRIEHLPEVALDAEEMPEMMVGVYDWAVVVDHRLKRAFLVSHVMHSETQQDWLALCTLFTEPAVRQ